MTTKRVLCYLGLHSWQRKKADDDGGWYKECRRCGRFRDVQPILPPVL